MQLDILAKKGQLVEQYAQYTTGSNAQSPANGASNHPSVVRPKLYARFMERITEYRKFWYGVKKMCNSYLSASTSNPAQPSNGANSSHNLPPGNNNHPSGGYTNGMNNHSTGYGNRAAYGGSVRPFVAQQQQPPAVAGPQPVGVPQAQQQWAPSAMNHQVFPPASNSGDGSANAATKLDSDGTASHMSGASNLSASSRVKQLSSHSSSQPSHKSQTTDVTDFSNYASECFAEQFKPSASPQCAGTPAMSTSASVATRSSDASEFNSYANNCFAEQYRPSARCTTATETTAIPSFNYEQNMEIMDHSAGNPSAAPGANNTSHTRTPTKYRCTQTYENLDKIDSL